MSLKENYEKINERILNACIKSGRKREDVTLMGVTKTIDADTINQAVKMGITTLGENRVQEFLSKYDLIENNPDWHIIGHLQTNKVKYIADKVSTIHSVESEKLAKTISAECAKVGKKMQVLVEVNVSGEQSKYGIKPECAKEFALKISQNPNIIVSGFMTMAPFGADKSDIHKYFAHLYKIYSDMKKYESDTLKMKYLSMGMSSDFEIAVEEGANIVRVGTSLFRG